MGTPSRHTHGRPAQRGAAAAGSAGGSSESGAVHALGTENAAGIAIERVGTAPGSSARTTLLAAAGRRAAADARSADAGSADAPGAGTAATGSRASGARHAGAPR